MRTNEQNTTLIPIKTTSLFSLPVLGLGTYQMGGDVSRNPDNDDELDIKAIRTAVKMGITHIDTAETYADGYSEIIVGNAIKGLDRDQLFITTKVRRHNLHYDDIIKSALSSMKRLNIKIIDLYLIHAPSINVPINESVKAMDYLLENELIRNIGVSNFNSYLLEEAMAATKYKIVSNQIHYSLLARAYEEDKTLEFCQKNNILVTAYRIIGHGQFDNKSRVILQDIAEKYKKTPNQVAINWVINKPNVVALIKSSNPNHLQENLGALGWRLNSEDEKYLNKNFPKGETINTPTELLNKEKP